MTLLGSLSVEGRSVEGSGMSPDWDEKICISGAILEDESISWYEVGFKSRAFKPEEQIKTSWDENASGGANTKSIWDIPPSELKRIGDPLEDAIEVGERGVTC